ncbi:MAG: hypothetical protein ACLQUY_19650 [Ktedonobacterales bacterium]
MQATVPPAEGTTPRWSLFARTLEDILGTPEHGQTPLSRLDNLRERPGEELDPDDPTSPRELVHRQKVQRLLLSLREPGTLTVLSRDDIERIRRYFHFDDEESLQLQAAILATHTQRVVYERFGDKDNPLKRRKAAVAALHAAELLLPTLMDALRQIGDEDSEAFRHAVEEQTELRQGQQERELAISLHTDSPQVEQARISAALAGALDAVDRGTLALDLSYSAPGYVERLERARAARDAFSDALELLDQQDAKVHSSELWQVWHAEARSGYEEANDRVADLGG